MSESLTGQNAKFEKVFEKLDTINNGLHALTLKIIETENKMVERQNIIRDQYTIELAKIRGEFSEYKIVVAKEMTANTVKTGIAFTILMVIVGAIITAFVKNN